MPNRNFNWRNRGPMNMGRPQNDWYDDRNPANMRRNEPYYADQYMVMPNNMTPPGAYNMPVQQGMMMQPNQMQGNTGNQGNQ